MEFIITLFFAAVSLLLLRFAERSQNTFAIVHIAFLIVFMQLLHLAGLFNTQDLNYDLTNYFFTYFAIFTYLVIFTFGVIWLKDAKLVPSQDHILTSAIDIREGWLIAAFCGWLLFKAYLVTKYGASAFSMYSRLEGQHAVRHFFTWWEKPMMNYLQAFAVGALVVYVIKLTALRNYWRKHWIVSLTAGLFIAFYISTASSSIGARRLMLILVVLGIAVAAWRKRETISHYLLSRWRAVLITALILTGLAVYYQLIRNNFYQPEIAEKLKSENPVTFAQGIIESMVPDLEERTKRRDEVMIIREGPFDIIYQVIQKRDDGNPGTGGAITANAFSMVTPRVITGDSKEDINADDFLDYQMGIVPKIRFVVSDVATSLIAIFVADFGFLGIFVAPVLMVFSIGVFSNIPRKGVLASTPFTLFLFSVLLSLAANVEGSLVPILANFRDALILAIAMFPLSFLHKSLFKTNKRPSRTMESATGFKSPQKLQR